MYDTFIWLKLLLYYCFISLQFLDNIMTIMLIRFADKNAIILTLQTWLKYY